MDWKDGQDGFCVIKGATGPHTGAESRVEMAGRSGPSVLEREVIWVGKGGCNR